MVRIRINLAPVMRAANRYADAKIAKAFEDTIPYQSDDPEEQELIDAAHDGINADLVAAEQALRRAVERLVLQYVDV